MTEKSRILLVDDVPENLVALQALLRRPDAEILLASSGTEALEMVLQYEIALAFLDVQMPEMDGFELAELMRGSERSKYIPIIFVTAGTSDSQRVFRGYESGAVDFLLKPLDPHALRHKANTFISLDQQRKQLADQYRRLQESEALMRDAVQARDDVLAVVSHDVRNFLQTIKSGVKLLSKPGNQLSTDVRATIHSRISSTVDLMSRVISDLLDMANIRSGRIEINPRPEIVDTLIAEAASVHELQAEEKGILLATRCDALHDVVICDRERILQVLSNLLSNALKFCSRGAAVTIQAKRLQDRIQISVSDTGPGIAAADLPLVFDAYWSGAANRRAGTGLGLYITKSIIEAHDSSIWLESELGQGTTAYFTLARAETT
jgi:signal transduction histidine kinase